MANLKKRMPLPNKKPSKSIAARAIKSANDGAVGITIETDGEFATLDLQSTLEFAKYLVTQAHVTDLMEVIRVFVTVNPITMNGQDIGADDFVQTLLMFRNSYIETGVQLSEAAERESDANDFEA